MTRESEPPAEGGTLDERIRGLAATPRRDHIPPGIENRVLSRVRRRRRVLRAGYVGMTAVVLLGVGLLASWLPQTGPQSNQLAGESTGDLSDPERVARPDSQIAQGSGEPVAVDRLAVEDLFVQLSAPPPVVSLDLIGADEYAMLDCLEALKEEFK